MIEPAAAKKQIITELSSRQVSLNASQTTDGFYVTVYNDSDRFASFQLRLLAAGVLPDVNKSWYRLTPSVSSKIPVGDSTRFKIEIFDLPPIAQQFRGAIDLTVEVTSRELESQYDRQPLRLLAEGFQGQPPNLSLIVPSIQTSPGERVGIVAQVHNPMRSPQEMTLRLSGLPDRWFPEGILQTLVVPFGKPLQVRFECEVPAPMEAPSQIYPLQLEATGRFPTVVTTGQFHILPAGEVLFACEPSEAAIPEVLGRWQNPTQGTATFGLQFENRSNLEPMVQFRVRDLKPKRRRFWQKSRSPEAEPVPALLPPGVSLAESSALPLPVGSSTIPLYIQRRLPWLGWARLHRFEVAAQPLESPIPLQPETQTLQVHLFPVIPLWLQILGTLLALGLGTLAWFLLTDPGHRGPVNSVQFNGQGTEVVSGSDDQTFRRWRVEGKQLHSQSHSGNLRRAIRVIRYRPVNNDQVALGFENGEIQIANLLTGERSRLTPDKDDRVFSLVFSRDSRTLFSGHGSGLVLQWDVTRLVPEQTIPQRAYNTRLTIETMALVGNEDRYLAMGGRYNRFLLMDINPNGNPGANTAATLEVPYPAGSPTDYISSFSVAEQQPNRLAIADNQGRISLWDTQACLQNRGRCAPTEKLWLGHAGSPVRSVALSADSCFLASAGDDGQVKLWALDGQGMRRSSDLEGRVLAQLNKPVNTVDIIETRGEIWVTSGGDDRRVRLYRARLDQEGRRGDFCPVLAGGGA